MTRRAHPVPRLDPDIARLAGALADRSRIAMLDALLDGSAQPIGALARRAGISAATASGHLRRLIDHQLVVVDPTGGVAPRPAGKAGRAPPSISLRSTATARRAASGWPAPPSPSCSSRSRPMPRPRWSRRPARRPVPHR
jgi:hypothetical protein